MLDLLPVELCRPVGGRACFSCSIAKRKGFVGETGYYNYLCEELNVV